MQNQEDENIEDIIGIFETYDISVSWLSTSIGPVIVKYDFKPKSDKDILRYKAKKDDILLAITSLLHSPRIYISHSDLYGSIIIVEVPKEEPTYVYLKDCLKDLQKEKYELPIILGKDIEGKLVIKDLVDIPNILMAGATGSGKSNFIDSVILTLLTAKTSDEVKLILVDPCIKMALYEGIPHLIFPPITDLKVANTTLTWCLDEMMRRYRQLQQVHVHTLPEYNKVLGNTAMPYIVVVIDDLADLMFDSGVEVESKIQRLAQMGEIVGIHMVLATSRPMVNIITGLIKAHIPGRVAFAVATEVDSRVILDCAGAETLLGNGDMLFKDKSTPKSIRIQAPIILFDEREELIKKLKTRKCLCDNPTCAKCLLVNCNDDNCKIHTLEKKKETRQRIYYPKIKELIESRTRITPEIMKKEFHLGYKEGGDLLNEFWDDELEKYDYIYKRIKKEIEENGSLNPQFLHREFSMSMLHEMKLMDILEKK